MSKNYKLENGNYIKISKTDDGYDYSLYDENKELIDGGILENINLNEKEALIEVLKLSNISITINYQELGEIEDFEEIDTNISIIEDEEEIEINITINTTKKVVYFSEMSGSGCKYPYKNMDDLKNRIQFYLEFYHPKIFNSKGKETKNE